MIRTYQAAMLSCLLLSTACSETESRDSVDDATVAAPDATRSTDGSATDSAVESDVAQLTDAGPMMSGDQGAPSADAASPTRDAGTMEERDSSAPGPDATPTEESDGSMVVPAQDASPPVDAGTPIDAAPMPELDAEPVMELDAAPVIELDAAMEADVVQACPAGEVRCAEDGPARLVCNPDNQTAERIPCDIDEFCADGVCQVQRCSPGELACDGDLIRRCNAVGDGFSPGEDEDCSAQGLGCVAGVCADAVEASRGAVCETIECLGRRAVSVVCGRYRSDIADHSRRPYRGGANRCDPGTLTDDAYDDALDATNYGRWLAGVAPVVYDDALNPAAQACATIMANQGNADHNPPPDWACYTEEGARAAAVSNIQVTFGGEPIPDSIVRFFWDEGRFNRRVVGHRRWMQSPTLGSIGFGYHEGRFTGDSAACLNVIGGAQVDATGPPFIAYPAPGPFPRELLKKGRERLPWSVAVDSLFPDEWPATEDWAVSVNRLGPDGPEALGITDLSANAVWHGRTRAVVFSPDFEPNEGRYEIVVESGERRYAWETEIVRCDPP